MNILTLHLKGEYFNQIAACAKTEEYRLCTPYWEKRIEGRHYDQIHLLLGYPNANNIAHRLVFPWRGYTVKTITHQQFGDDPVLVYAIPLEDRRGQR